MSKVKELAGKLRDRWLNASVAFQNAQEAADLLTEQAGEIETWAKLAMDLNTYAEHDQDCLRNRWGGTPACTCGLSGFVRALNKMAEGLASHAALSVKE